MANDKYAVLEQKLVASELRVKNLESENDGLRRDLKQAEIEIQNSKNLAENAQGVRLEEIREKVLILLGQVTEIRESRIAIQLNLSAQMTKFHLAELKTANLATYPSIVGTSDQEWRITQDGRSYLVSHGLLT